MRPIRVATPFTVTTLKPGAPTGLAGSVVSSIIVELTWDAQTWTVDGLVGTIEIQRSADNSTWATVHRVDGSLTAFDFPRVAAQQYFRIRAVFEGFASAWTSSVLINSAPVVTVPIAQSGTEDTNKSITGTSVSDADNPVSLSMTVAQTNGTISLAGITGLSFSVGDGTSDSTMTFTGSIANINTALATLTVIPTANYTGASAVTTITANDGHASPVSATITTTFSAVNDAPVVTCSGGTTAYVENDAATVVDGSLTVADVDSSTVTAMEAQITANFQTAEDVLAAPVDANGITWGSFNTGTGKIVATCSGTTTAQAQAALRLVTYENTSEAPNTSTRVVTFKVTDASSLQSTGATKSVSVAAVNDAPQINISGVQPAAVVMDSPCLCPGRFAQPRRRHQPDGFRRRSHVADNATLGHAWHAIAWQSNRLDLQRRRRHQRRNDDVFGNDHEPERSIRGNAIQPDDVVYRQRRSVDRRLRRHDAFERLNQHSSFLMSTPIIQIRDAVIGRLTEYGASEDVPVEFAPAAALYPDFKKTDAALQVIVIASGLSASTAARDTDGKGYTLDIGIFKPIDRTSEDTEAEQVEKLIALVDGILSFLRSDDGTLTDPDESAEWTAVDAVWDDEVEPNTPVLYDQLQLREGGVFVSHQSAPYKFYADRSGGA